MLENPFLYGKPVEGEYYFDLAYLKKEMQSYLDAKINILLIGPRRSGKTSFLKSFLKDQRLKKRAVIEIDAFNVLSHKDFLNQYLNVLKKEQSNMRRFFDWVRGVKHLSPAFTWEVSPHTGETSYTLNFDKLKEIDIKQTILETLQGLKVLPHPLVVSIDEFQRIGELEDKGWLEATLRSTMQEFPQITFIFTGSRRSILEDMFNNSKRPFYKSCKQIYFPTFGREFSDWVIDRFHKVGITAQPEAIDYLREKVEDSPNYVQEVCFHLVSHGIQDVSLVKMDAMLETVAIQSTYSYEALLDTLTVPQIKFLKLFIGEGKIDYTKDVLAQYEIKSGSTLQSAFKALEDKQIMIKEPGGQVKLEDPLFKIWLSKKFATS